MNDKSDKSKEISDDKLAEKEFKSLVKTQKSLKKCIDAFCSNHKKTSKSRQTLGYLEGRLTGMKNLWQQYCEGKTQICAIVTEEQIKEIEFLDTEYETIEEIYYNFIGEIQDALYALTYTNNVANASPNSNHTGQSSTSQGNVHSAEAQLPRIVLPKFSGSYETWKSFYDLFCSLIHHNTSLPKVQKLHYLKTSLEGEAERLVRSLSITAENYEPALEILKNRYNNKRVLVDSQLRILTSQPPLKLESADSLKKLLDVTNECLRTLQNFGLKVEEWDAIVIFLILQKLPAKTQLAWDQSLQNSAELPKLQTFIDFLETRFRSLERLHCSQVGITVNKEQKFSTPIKYPSFHKREVNAFHSAYNATSCPLCSKRHSLRQCPQFLKLNAQARLEFVARKSFCINCLAYSHQSQGCVSPKKCYYCGKGHHSLLHDKSLGAGINATSPSTSNNTSQPLNTREKIYHTTSATNNDESSRVSSFFSNEQLDSSPGLLATALVKVETSSGTHVLRALIDSGSQSSFITEASTQRLHLRKKRISAHITGLGSTHTTTSSSQVNITIRSLYNESFSMDVNALVLKSVADLLPPQSIKTSQAWYHIQGLRLADPTFNTPGGIDLLLGIDVYAFILSPGIKKGPPNAPTAQNTALGWILFGSVYNLNKADAQSTLVNFHSCVEIESLLKQFWELEEPPQQTCLTTEELECEYLFENSYQRLSDGRFQVNLPFLASKPSPITFGRSRNHAVSRWTQLERRLMKKPALYAEYTKCLAEYVEMGHMKPSPSTEDDHRSNNHGDMPLFTCYYMPHHAVTKESSSTKVRVVFNASQRAEDGFSLNETVLSGPKLQNDLTTILLRWRQHLVAFTADIRQMYRQIRISPEDSNYQRIIWRPHPQEQIQDYNLQTVTFGVACAPYLAIKCLHKLAELESQKYPTAATAILNDFYVDDILSGADTLKEALQLQSDLITVLSSAGFDLRKWACNR